MADLNDIHLMLGKFGAKLDDIANDISEVKVDIRENIKPPIESYKRDRNILIGAAMGVSAIFGSLFGGIGKAIAKVMGS